MIVTESELKVDAIEIKKAVLILRAVNHKLRQQMLTLLHANKRMNVTDLYVKLQLEQSVASQHLAILRKAGFVLAERNQKNIFYSVNYGRLKQVEQLAEQILHT
jgi:DNA-binding transcriptional ArsR family regulator